MTSSAISGRSVPSSDRAVVSYAIVPSSIRETTASAVNPFEPLAIANRVPGVFAIPYARSASPTARSSTVRSPSSTRTTPENRAAETASSISPRGSTPGDPTAGRGVGTRA